MDGKRDKWKEREINGQEEINGWKERNRWKKTKWEINGQKQR